MRQLTLLAVEQEERPVRALQQVVAAPPNLRDCELSWDYPPRLVHTLQTLRHAVPWLQAVRIRSPWETL